MQNEQKLIEQIESYLKGELSPQEVIEFDKLRAGNSMIHDQFVQHQFFLQHLSDYSKRKDLILEMEKVHKQLDIEAIKQQSFSSSSKIRLLWSKYRVNIAVAASMTILTTIITLISTGYFSRSGADKYSLLRREVNNLKHSQSVLMKNINKNAKSANNSINPGRFGGTGFMIAPNGYLITNYHVIQGADSISVQSVEGQIFKANQIYIDPAYDLAVLQIVDSNFKPFANLPYTFKRSQVDLGEDVFTIGFPDDKSVYGKGYVSSRIGYLGDTLAYQVSIPVNPGNSGGPLLDRQGNIIGIISGKQLQLDGVAFAIKSQFLVQSLEAISQDFFERKLVLTKRNMLEGLDRKQQIKKLQNYVFMVKVY